MNVEVQRIAPAPIRHSLRVKAPPEKAFDVFAGGMGRWWLESHSLLEGRRRDVVVEPRPGGRWYEVGEDGSERDWGRVIAWERPGRLLLDWQLDADWRHDSDFHSEVEVRFTAEEDGTRVEFEHRGLDAYGERAEATRAAMDGGWGELLAGYERASESPLDERANLA